MPALVIRGLGKTFTRHLQGGVEIPVLQSLDLDLEAGESLVLAGASGMGKSTVLKLVYGSYRAQAGSIRIAHAGAMTELVGAPPRLILDVRRYTLGYVSQFLRVIPRVAALDVVAEPLVATGIGKDEARAAAATMLRRLNIPERLWPLPPATFSGGEQQRLNIARGFVHPFPVLLLDEPTASLDALNRRAVIELIDEAKTRGAAILGIFHDHDVRDAVASRLLDVERLKAAA